jgi:hypothetical protein
VRKKISRQKLNLCPNEHPCSSLAYLVWPGLEGAYRIFGMAAEAKNFCCWPPSSFVSFGPQADQFRDDDQDFLAPPILEE